MMDQRTRLQALLEKLEALDGISERSFQAIAHELDNEHTQFGYDEDGKLKVAMFDARAYEIEAFNKANSSAIVLNASPTALDIKNVKLAQGCKVVCIFVNDRCDADIVKALAKMGVELIALRCAGFNNVDLEACKANNIDVVRVPAYSPHAVAEHAVALMMMLNRNLHRAYLRNRSGQFVLDGLVGFDMFGKTVGVIGTGKIGQCVINILTGFGCNILAFDKYPNSDLQQQANVKYTDMDELEINSDIITLHAPLSEDTQHLINKESIAKMKDGVMIINTSRGGLVDTAALIEGLKTEKVGSAGLDVYEEESGIFFHDVSGQVMQDEIFARLLTFSNVLITSHQAFLTNEALANIAATTLGNIDEFAGGKRGAELSNLVPIA
jgi:D-lactate dehydrogenase